MNISLGYDLYTQSLHNSIAEEQHFWENHDECPCCKKIYHCTWEEVSESRLELGLYFCCTKCRDSWDCDNVDDYFEHGIDLEDAFEVLIRGEQ